MRKPSSSSAWMRYSSRFALVIALILLIGTPSVLAQTNTVTGVVFRDFDMDGVQGSNEPPFAGVTVTVTGTASGPVSFTTLANGAYSLNYTGTDARVEFTLPVGSDFRTTGFGSDSATSVQFVTGTTTADYGVLLPGDYCQADPRLSLSCFVVGDNSVSAEPVVISYPYSTNAQQPLPTEVTISDANEAGTVYGIAWQSTTRSVYSSAYVKRGAGLGVSNSTGTIYRTANADSATPGATSIFIELNGLGSIATGANPHPNGTPALTVEQGTAAFQAVGLAGLGDLEINDDEDTLYTVNLNQRTLIVVPIDNSGAVPTAISGSVQSIPVPVPGDCAVDYRPFGLGYHDGFLYLGMVCSGASLLTPAIDTWAEVAPLLASLQGYVYRFNPGTNAFDGAPLLQFPLNYPRQFVNEGFPDPVPGTPNNENDGEWLPWTNVWEPGYAPFRPGTRALISNPQPMLTDIEFDGQGFMMLGMRDRFADQSYSEDDYSPFGGAPRTPPLRSSRQGGDILLACQGSGGAWSLENNGTCGTRTSVSTQTDAGPGGDEFYFDEQFGAFHRETALGSLALIPGRNELVSTVYDVYATFEAGTITFSNSAGNRVRGAQILPPDSAFQKGGGLGDLELLCAPAPIQIGNRVWIDSNNNGQQDPGEAPIPNVEVELLSPGGASLGTVTTGPDGTYYFSSGPQVGAVTTNALYGIAGLTYNTANFRVVIDPAQTALAGYQYTSAPNTGADTTDSDGVLNGATGDLEATFATGGRAENNHTYDFGFRQVSDRGDLPDTAAGIGAGNYETLIANGGPSHPIVTGLLMGATVDAEADGQPNATANGDDTTLTPDDEDGVTVTTLVVGSPAVFSVSVTNTTGTPANLFGFLDLTGDGDFTDPGETATVTTATGTVSLTFGSVPAGTTQLYARFRLSTDATLTANGAATDGEVEDYVFPLAVVDRGDLPDTAAGIGAGNYETLIANGGPSHPIVTGLLMGATVDAEADGQPNAAANGDDTTLTPDDEDGVTVTTLVVGSPAVFSVSVTNTTGTPANLFGFLDLTGDGDFADPGETATVTTASGTVSLTFGSVPAGTTQLYARFRLSTDATLTANGAATDGEVEDYVFPLALVDRGDLPDTAAGIGAGNYETLIANGGPSHPIVTGLLMGATVDAEADGQPNAAANGDDTTLTPDDEDGVTVTTLVVGSPAVFSVSVTNTTGTPANLFGFLDLTGDGDFLDAGETSSVTAATGTVSLTFGSVPAGTTQLYARFRLSTDAVLTANGAATNGEVEDYVFPLALVDRGDLPDTAAGIGAGNYETLIANGGPSHPIVTGLLMGATVDAEADGQPNATANGDDTTLTPDDEDGVTVTTLVVGSPAVFSVSVTNTTGTPANLFGFLDLTGDGDFLDAGETASVTAATGTVSLTFGSVPAGTTQLYARFRLSTDATLTANGAATDGEVEDYVFPLALVDRGDLPDTAAGIGAGNYETLIANGGPSHPIVTGLLMGATVDAEADGQPNATADGDDTTLTPDDEDGVTVTTLVVGSPAVFSVSVTNTTGTPANLFGFLDLTGDGDFLDAGETASVTVATGTVSLTFGSVPAGTTQLYARFRLSTDAVLTANGAATNGEVEDYVFPLALVDRGDLPDTAAGIGAGNYETLIANGGPSHPIVTGLLMGATVDAEANGQPNATADGDDTALTPDDEDGVTVTTLVVGSPAVFSVSVTNTTGTPANLFGFLDLTGDGDFLDAGETASVTAASGTVSLTFGSVPAGTTQLYARFRLSTDAVLTANGAATNGEVEDYVFPLALVDRGDLPDTAAGIGAGNYETLIANGGPSHPIVTGLLMGATVDAEANGQPNATADSDDTALTPDDEDGVTVTTLVVGSPAVFSVSVTNTTGTPANLFGFLDLTGDGDFLDAGETASVTAATGTVSLTFGSVPAGTTQLYARFRLSTDSTLTANGAATNGEVEDYVFPLAPLSLGNLVWNDLNNDGNLDGGEAGIDGVTVQLYRDSNGDNIPDGAPIATTTTAGGGYYLFDNLLPGSYIVGIPATDFQGTNPLVGFLSSTGPGQQANPNGDIDSDDNGLDTPTPDVGGVFSNAITLTIGGEPAGDDETGSGLGSAADNSSNLTLDFGFFQPPANTLSLGNLVWIDTDNSGTVNGSESGIGGVVVNLIQNGAVIATTTTNGSGYYLFVGLAPGDYVVQVAPSNFASGGVLFGSTSSTGAGQEPDPENSGDINDNGIDNADPATNGVSSGLVTLALTVEPIDESDLGSGTGGAPNNSSNLTVDFGFSQPLVTGTPPPPPPPVTRDPAIVKLADPAFALPGEAVTFIITVTNPNSIPLDSVIFTDIVPNQFTVLGATATAGTVTVTGQTVSYFFQTMPPLSSFEVRIQTRVRDDVVPPLAVDNIAMLGGIYSGRATATVTIDFGDISARVTQLPSTGETPWWRTPVLVGGGLLLLAAGYAGLRRAKRDLIG